MTTMSHFVGPVSDLIHTGMTDHAAAIVDQQPVPAPIRPRHPTSPAEVQRLASVIWGDAGPAHPAGARAFLARELPYVYVPSVMKESRIFRFLDDTVTNGRPLFVHGLVPGVGARMLIANYARAFNERAGQHHDARRMKTIMISARAKTITSVLDSIASQLKVPISTTEHRRVNEYLIHRILGAIARHNISTVAIASVSKAHPIAREVVAELLLATNPAYHVDVEPHPLQDAARRVGFIFVDSVPPETVFASQPDVLVMLENRYTYVRPLQTYDEVGEFLRGSDIGLADLDLQVQDDLDMVECLVSNTGGLLAQIRPFLEFVDSIITQSGGIRPTPDVFNAVLPLYRRMVNLREVAADVHGTPAYELRARRQQRSLLRTPADAMSGSPPGRFSDSARSIAKRKDTKEHARRATAATLRKSFTSMAADSAYDTTHADERAESGAASSATEA